MKGKVEKTLLIRQELLVTKFNKILTENLKQTNKQNKIKLIFILIKQAV